MFKAMFLVGPASIIGIIAVLAIIAVIIIAVTKN